MMPSRRGRKIILLDSRAGPNAIAPRSINFIVDSRADRAKANYFNIDSRADRAKSNYLNIDSRAPLRRDHYFIVDSCAAIRCLRAEATCYSRSHSLPSLQRTYHYFRARPFAVVATLGHSHLLRSVDALALRPLNYLLRRGHFIPLAQTFPFLLRRGYPRHRTITKHLILPRLLMPSRPICLCA